MSTPMTFADARLAKLDGFRVEIDSERERAPLVAAIKDAFVPVTHTLTLTPQ